MNTIDEAVLVEPQRALDARYYTDQAIYAKEKNTFLARTWHFAGHVSLVANVGDYFTFSIGEQNLFCIRGRDNSVRAFYNVCQHRAHELVSGRGSSKVLVCPYHAWSYELDGRLRAGPNIKVVAGFDRNKICLTEVRTQIFCGFVFANLDLHADPMSEWFPGVEKELRSFVPQIDTLTPLLSFEIPEKCNWKVSIENYNECYHCSLNHPTFSTGVIKPETYNISPQGYCLRHTTECANLDRMTYPVDLTAGEHAGEYSSWFLWPTFSFQVYPGGVLNTYHWQILDIENVTVWREWYGIEGIAPDVIRKIAEQDRATTVEEDIHLVESVQRGLRSRGYRPGPLVVDPNCGVNSEHAISKLHQWIRDEADEG